MLLHCNHCNTTAEVKLNHKTENPICLTCNKEVTGLSPFTINTMKSQKDFLEKTKKAFSFHCDNCKEVHGGNLSNNKQYVVCTVCGKKMNVSAHMLNTMKMLDK